MKVVDLSGVCIYKDLIDRLNKSEKIDQVICYKENAHDDEEILERIGDVDIVISFLLNISENVLKKAPNLKMISLATSGFDSVDLVAAKEKGILVCNAPGYATEAVAEHAIGLMLAAARRTIDSIKELKSGIYDHRKYQGKQLRGKTLGIVGYGRIGQRVAEIAKNGFDMQILYTDQNSGPQDFENLLAKSDFISLHVPLTESTKGMIGYKQFDMMKEGVVLVNTARGGVIDENALIKNLESGKVFAAGLDVLANEPMESKDPLIDHPHVYVTPHIAYNSDESRYLSAKMAIDNVFKYLDGNPENIVCRP